MKADNIESIRIIAYGAGTMAKLYLPELAKYCTVECILDKGAIYGQKLYNTEVIKPDFEKLSAEPDDVKEKSVVILFIGDPRVRFEIEQRLSSIGYTKLYRIETVLRYLYNGISIDKLIRDYQIIGFENAEVIFDILDKKELTEDENSASAKAYDVELALRNMLDDKSRTEYRPIRMSHVGYYDPFAVYEKLVERYISKGYSVDEGIGILEQFLNMAVNKEPVVGLYVDILLEKREFERSLQIMKKAITEEPNSLFYSTVLEKIKNRCEQEGVDIYIPFPVEDLSEHFCFSGVIFSTCEELRGNGASLNPCFRGHQCAARPDGNFWSGQEWVEFRRSLFDGSFRYCQKDRCPNILGGWLPRKEDYSADWMRRMVDGDYSQTPPLEEMHLSYDNHCNLMCNSCRREIKTIDKTKTDGLNEQFELYLREILRNCKHLTLSGCGEACISPHGRLILQSLSKDEYPKLSVELRTNVFSLSEKTWENLGSGREVIKHITASVDGATKETFERLRYPAKWGIFTKNLIFIQQLRHKGEIEFFEFHVVVQTANIDELLLIAKMALAYEADAVTFSQIVFWNNMKKSEYFELNPYYIDHPRHEDLLREVKRLDVFRRECLKKLGRPFYINIHGLPDPDESYKTIRMGKLKVR